MRKIYGGGCYFTLFLLFSVMWLGIRASFSIARRRIKKAGQTLPKGPSRPSPLRFKCGERWDPTSALCYASYPLPKDTTPLEEAVAWVAAGRGSLRQSMKVFEVDKKTMKNYLLRYMNGEPVCLGRPGPPPRVDDHYMRKWLQQQLLCSLTPCKQNIIDEARRHSTEHGLKLGIGTKWWCLFKARNKDVVGRIPSQVESQRADGRLDEDQWQEFFDEASKALVEVDYDCRCACVHVHFWHE